MSVMFPALLWLIAGLLLVVGEALSGDFVLVMLGAAALGAAGASALGVPMGLDAVVFAALSFGLLMLARPALKRRMSLRELRTNTEALIGKHVLVESTVDAHGGRVSIDGDVWSAKAFDETQVMEAGSTVTVMDISGATAVVWAEP